MQVAKSSNCMRSATAITIIAWEVFSSCYVNRVLVVGCRCHELRRLRGDTACGVTSTAFIFARAEFGTGCLLACWFVVVLLATLVLLRNLLHPYHVARPLVVLPNMRDNSFKSGWDLELGCCQWWQKVLVVTVPRQFLVGATPTLPPLTISRGVPTLYSIVQISKIAFENIPFWNTRACNMHVL
jgi:hypothetical protein